MDATLTTNQSAQLNGQDAFEAALVNSLNLDTWTSGQNLEELYRKLEGEVKSTVENEEQVVKTLRKEIIPQLINNLDGIHPSIAFNRFSTHQLEKAHRGLLFNGGTEASDGTIVTHDTLPLTITQIGVCLVSYNGEQGAYAHRIYRKDLQIKGEDPIREVMELLEERRHREAQTQEDDSPQFKSALAQRGLMGYAERAILIEKSNANWRMGHGNPFPYELLTGFWASREEMARAATQLFEKIVTHKRFVFIPSAPRRRELLALGNALRPMEYLVVSTMKSELERVIENGGVRGKMKAIQENFAEEYGDQVVMGLYRASEYSPAFMFYAHRDHIQSAALIAVADSVLQEHRGFPMLIDIADNICASTFSADSFFSTIRHAYAEAGQPFRYLGERETRSR